MKKKINDLVKNFIDKQYKPNTTKYAAIAGILALNALLFPNFKEVYQRIFTNKAEITHMVKYFYKLVLY